MSAHHTGANNKLKGITTINNAATATIKAIQKVVFAGLDNFSLIDDASYHNER